MVAAARFASLSDYPAIFRDTVIDYDRVMVLADGKIVEFDTPWTLIRKEGGLFRSFCEQSGRYHELYDAAEKASQGKSR